MSSREKAKKTGRTIIIRAKVSAVIITVLLVALIVRLANLQLVDANDLKDRALDQYANEVTISAKRGTIYDRNYKALAISATVYNVFISPNDIKSNEQMNLIVNGLSEILGVDRQDIQKRCEIKKSKYQIIKRAIEDEQEEMVRTFITENELEGIVNLEESTKRYYPYSSLASQAMGYVGMDNNGLYGIEKTYDEYLRGTDGRSIRGYDAHGGPRPFKYESFIEAQPGLNLVTSIDYTIQSVLEKYIEQAYYDHKPVGIINGLVMEVDTGEILASAIYPNFDLNNYNKLNETYQKQLDEYEGTEEEKDALRSELLFKMWDNSIATKTYEPGSTFKVITSAMALEEGVIKPDDKFTCKGQITVAGRVIHCHTSPHGTQPFTTMLQKSCNPTFVQVGLKVGTELFMKNFNAFGYTKTSGSDVLGEVSSYYFETSNTQFKELELAVYSFGQTFKVTPLQHLRAVSTIANGGDLVTPHFAKALVDNEGNTVKTFEFEPDRQVISQETCDIILETLVNSTKNACVNGYNVVSKTGTSQKQDTPKEDDYISSCVTFAPAEDPKIAILITVDEPTSGPYYGSLVAAPVISNVLTEVLPYLGIEPTNADTDTVTLGGYIGSDSEEAKTVIENLGLRCIIKGEGGAVTDQIPAKGSVITDDGLVVLYTNGQTVEQNIKVPNVMNYTPSAANRTIINSNLNISIKGIYDNNYTNCTVVSQSPSAGETVAPGTVIEVEFIYDEDIE